jgi:hypothetical protein
MVDRETLPDLRDESLRAIETDAGKIAESMIRPVVRGEMLLLPEP